MDHSYTRQSKLIKQINLFVWGLLFIAGTILCQRVYSEHRGSGTEVSVADAGQTENAPTIDDLLGSGTDELITEETLEAETQESVVDNIDEPQQQSEEAGLENEVAEVTAPTQPEVEQPTTKPEVTQTATSSIKPPPRRTRKSKTQSRKPPKKSTPPTLATSPINADTKTTQVDSGAGSEIDSPTRTRTRNTKTVPKRRRPPRTSKTAQSSINLTTPSEATKPKEATADSVTATQQPKQTVATTTVEQPKQPVKKQPVTKALPKANPRQLTIENPKKIGYPVSFLIGNEQQTLQPGDKFERLLDQPSSKANVHFDRGGSFGEAIMDMTPGAYEFKVTREGWNIVPQKSQ